MELATNFCPKFLMIKSQHLSRKMTKGWGSNYETDTRSEILNMANNLYIYLTVDNTIKKEEVEKKKKAFTSSVISKPKALQGILWVY